MTSQSREDFISTYRDHYANVLNYVRRRVEEAWVEDVVSETFMIAWRRRDDIRSPMRAWLFKTASHVIRNRQRGQKHENRVARYGDSDVVRTHSDAALDVVAAWRRLPRRDQEALALHAWEDLPDREAAIVLGCSRAAYSMRLARAKRRLADELVAYDARDQVRTPNPQTQGGTS